ncbi:hypothetical protein BHE74_00035567, partial [Ensete ventricosum]
LYNRKVRPWQILTSDLVLRKTEVSNPTRSRGKLASNWEDPYHVINALREVTYKLAMMERNQLPRTWHISNL